MRVGRHDIQISRPEKPLFPDRTTKGDLVAYYREIGETMVPHLAGRPLTMHRFPDGAGAPGFYQQERPDYFPGWVHRVTVRKEGGRVTHVVCDDVATLVYLANQACITPHVWLSTRKRLQHPDRLIFDLDPSDDDFEPVRAAALLLRDLLAELHLTPFVMTTGSRGLHVAVPLDRQADFDHVRGFARRVAEIVVNEGPERFTTEQRKAKRAGRLFIDVARNAYAQTAVAPYSVRARSRPSVATPLEWEEVRRGDLGPDTYAIADIVPRVSGSPDPWRHIGRHAGSIATGRDRVTQLGLERR